MQRCVVIHRWLAAAVPRRAGLLLLGLAALAALAFTAGDADAQTSTGTIRGYVTTTGGSPVAQAIVTARDVQTNQTRTVRTSDTNGFYSMGGLRPAPYEITVRRVGLGPQSRTLTLAIGQTLDANFTMTETAVALEEVQITASSTIAETRTSEVATNVSREQIQNLPNFERNFLDIARLAPGMTAQNVNSTDKTIAAAGQPAEAVNIFIDGASYKNDVLRGGVVGQDASKGNPFPQGAVQEFRVITQNYKAEYQKAASAVITATTRTGSNQFEADAFAYGVGKSYVARDAFTASNGGARPDYQRLQAGASIGGPIVPDRLFYFGTYELNFRDEPAYVLLGGDSARVPAALKQQLAASTGQFTQEFREHLGFGKVTWIADDRSTVDASINVRLDKDFRGFGGQTAFDAAEDMKVDVYTGVANWKYAGDQWLNELQASGQSFTWNPTWKNGNLVGRDYQNVLRTGGKDSEQDFKQTRLSLRNDVTRTSVHLAGDHVFKAGASVDFLRYDATKFQLGNPVFRFRADENYARPFEAAFGFGDPSIETNNTQFGGYIQDDWTVTPRLVLNLGLRWDAETNMINNGYVTPQPLADSLRGPLAGQFFVDQPLPGGATRQVRVVDELGGIDRYITTGRDDRPMYLKAFQPRLGASYGVAGDGRTVVFGGWGIYYDRNYWNTLFDEQYRRQFRVLTVAFRDECGAGSPANCAVWNDRYFDPAQLRTLSGSSGVPEVFLVANDLTPPRTMQMSGGIRQSLGPTQLTLSYNGVRGKNYMNYVRATPWGGLGPNYAQAFVTDDRVRTWYDALQLQLQRPLVGDARWGGGIAYTLARSEEQGQSTDLFWGFDDRYPTVGDRPRLRAPGDQRHSVVINAVARLPYDVMLSGIASMGTGISVNATDASRGFETGNQVTYVFTPPTRPFLGIGHVFASQTLDLRAEKVLQVPGGQSVSVLVDVFNSLNNANYGCFNTTINPVNDPNPNYGKPGCAGLGRRLQVGLRYGYNAYRP